ncbi:hypothetical protein [Streptomyces sp. NPDC002133]|uniref:hypothetical protein n=1 Tax=Streptomyces sp. NPDC002133 TaxID=3154409 RepID=UPI00331B9CD1
MASDPGGELGPGGLAGCQAGDQVDALDGEFVGAEAASPANDLEGLSRVGVVQVRERSGRVGVEGVERLSPANEVDLAGGQQLDLVGDRAGQDSGNEQFTAVDIQGQADDGERLGGCAHAIRSNVTLSMAWALRSPANAATT